MLIHVSQWNLWAGAKNRMINADLIKTVDYYTCANFQRDSNSKITFVDGSTMKVIDSVSDICKDCNGK